MSSAEVVAAQAPIHKELLPMPLPSERVCFVNLLPRGFGFLLHDFVRGLLFSYGIQMHDLNPSSVLHITCFVVLCECFLGVHPTWTIWKHIFEVSLLYCDGRPLSTGGSCIDAHEF